MSGSSKATADRRASSGTRPAAERVRRKPRIGDVDDPMEREAEAMAKRVAAGQPAAEILRAAAPEKKQEPVRRAAAPEPKKDEPVRRAAAPEKKNDEPIRRAAAAPETKKEEPVRRAAAPEKKQEPVRRAAAPETKEDEPVRRQAEEDDVQAKSAGGSSSDAMSSAAQHAIASKGPGQPLDSSVRSRIESSTGAEMGHVRVHDDAAARASANAINARAFTHGSDIWMGPGESSSDVHLMAHEAAHVIQQAGAAQRLVQRAGGAPAGGAATPAAGDAGGEALDPGKVVEPDKIVYPSIRLPKFKATDYGEHKARALYQTRAGAGKLRRQKKYKRGNPDQTTAWDSKVTVTGIEKKVQALLASTSSTSADKTNVLKHKKSGYHVIGTKAEIVEAGKRPLWDRDGKPKPKDVDHVVELQISGWPGDTWANQPADNMELMDSAANQDSGRTIMWEVVHHIDATIAKYAPKKKGDPLDPSLDAKFWGKKDPPSVSAIKARYDLVFDKVDTATLKEVGAPQTNYWALAEVNRGGQFDDFEVRTEGFAAGLWTLFPKKSGGLPKEVQHSGGKERAASAADNAESWLQPFRVEAVSLLDPAKVPASGAQDLGSISLGLDQDKETKKKYGFGTAKSITVRSYPGLPNAGYLDSDHVMSVWRSLDIRGLSPIDISSWGVERNVGFVAIGRLLPSVPLLADLEIDLVIAGKDIRLRKLIDTGSFSVPGPIAVTGSSLEIFAGTMGIGVAGDMSFAIEELGRGRLGAAVTAKGLSSEDVSFALDGEFNFDSELFDPASVKMWYRDKKLGGEGHIGIKEGKVKGIKSADIVVNAEGERFDAKGTIKPKIPGIEQGDITVKYVPDEGLTVAGVLKLSNSIPGIKSGSIDATVHKPAGEPTYTLSAHGTAVPSIPGLDTVLTVEYDDGALTIAGSAEYARGMLSGSVQLGATNRVLDATGTPTDAIGKEMRVYGGGTLTVKVTPWLQGTVGVRFLPNGELELTGSIALPDTLDIFPEKRLDKNIFAINLDIPILGFAVAGQRVGIFATIGGGLDLSAGIGPGQLRELGIGITYNPAHEEKTRIHGGAKLVIPAHAGLRLFVRAALGAGIPIVSASLGLEVGARLGLEGAVEASVKVDWTPSTGLTLDALGEIYVQPKFRFDLTGFLMVDADLVVSKFNLYEKRWELAAFELGPDLRFGVRFPIHYQEGKPFDMSMDDLQFEVPKVDTKALLGEMIGKIV